MSENFPNSTKDIREAYRLKKQWGWIDGNTMYSCMKMEKMRPVEIIPRISRGR
jgi:hypothetical protein